MAQLGQPPLGDGRVAAEQPAKVGGGQEQADSRLARPGAVGRLLAEDERDVTLDVAGPKQRPHGPAAATADPSSTLPR